MKVHVSSYNKTKHQTILQREIQENIYNLISLIFTKELIKMYIFCNVFVYIFLKSINVGHIIS